MADGVKVRSIHRKIAREGLLLQLKAHTGKILEELDKDMQSFIEWEIEVKAHNIAREQELERAFHKLEVFENL